MHILRNSKTERLSKAFTFDISVRSDRGNEVRA